MLSTVELSITPVGSSWKPKRNLSTVELLIRCGGGSYGTGKVNLKLSTVELLIILVGGSMRPKKNSWTVELSIRCRGGSYGTRNLRGYS